jgi:hypothetical protein
MAKCTEVEDTRAWAATDAMEGRELWDKHWTGSSRLTNICLCFSVNDTDNVGVNTTEMVFAPSSPVSSTEEWEWMSVLLPFSV